MAIIQAATAYISFSAEINQTTTGLKAEEVEKWFAEAATRDPDDAKANGIVHDIRDAQIPPGAPFYQLAFKR